MSACQLRRSLGNGMKPIFFAGPARVLDGRAFMAAGRASRTLTQRLTRRAARHRMTATAHATGA
jgi:hypothetical protein